jgi:hypothetical protein
MNLFIDTNVLLDFYHLTGTDIEELHKLVALLDAKTVTLFVPANLRDEFDRNRGNKIADAMATFKKASFKVSFPAFCKLYPQYGSLQALLKEADKKFSELHNAAMNDAIAGTLKADEIVEALFERAQQVDATEDLHLAAMRRLRIGNPPGKKKVTYGDELNWEALLKSIPVGQELHLVSHDNDYVSPLESSEIHPFLAREWGDKKKSSVTLYRSLPQFFEAKFPKIVLASDVKKSALIDQLAKSKNFASTHLAIAGLSAIDGFSPAQVEELIEIAEKNSQVGWIMGDDDVLAFYSKLKADNVNFISPATMKRLEALFPDEDAPGNDQDEIPW